MIWTNVFTYLSILNYTLCDINDHGTFRKAAAGGKLIAGSSILLTIQVSSLSCVGARRRVRFISPIFLSSILLKIINNKMTHNIKSRPVSQRGWGGGEAEDAKRNVKFTHRRYKMTVGCIRYFYTITTSDNNAGGCG